MAILQFSPRHAGGILRTMRKSRGWTLRELAQRTGLSVSFLSDIERQRTDPSLQTLEKLGIAYGGTVVISFEYKGEALPFDQLRAAKDSTHARD